MHIVSVFFLMLYDVEQCMFNVQLPTSNPHDWFMWCIS